MMLDSLANILVYTLLEFQNNFERLVAGREPWQWFFFFFPFYVFGEFPRYVLPAVVLGAKHALQRRRPQLLIPARHHSVSVLLVGFNEEESICQAIRSLLEFDYPGLEIVVVDDNSTDNMYEAAKPFADKGLIRLVKNTAATGRAGRPVVSNLAYKLSTGDILISVDSDTSFDRDALSHLLAPFEDPQVGVVAGNLKPRNAYHNLLTQFQAIEYLQSITLWKMWLNLLGCNMQASGALGAFRRVALERCGGWDPELSEDADLSLKIKKTGYKIVFAPEAIGMTNVPDSWGQFRRQRTRWDKGMLRTYFRKHRNLMQFWIFDGGSAAEMTLEFIFTVALTLLYFGWLAFMLVKFPYFLLYVFSIVYVVYFLTTLLSLTVALALSERRSEEWQLVFAAPFFPFFKSWSRWVRCMAFIQEIPRINYEDGYLPESAWRNAPRY